MLIHLLEGDLPHAAPTVTLRAKGGDGNGGEFFLEVEDAGRPTAKAPVRCIDGFLFDDPASDGSDRVVLWSCIDRRRNEGLPGATVPFDSAARVIGASYGYGPSSGPAQFQLTKHGMTAAQPVLLNVPEGTWRVQEIDDIFFGRVIALCDTDLKITFPEYPVRPEWVAAVEEIFNRPEYGADGKLTKLTYTVRLRGLASPVVRDYESADIEIHGDATKADPMRVMVWPNIDLESWCFYSLEVGQNKEEAWLQNRWGVFTTASKEHGEDNRMAECRNDTMLPYRLFPCRSAGPRGDAARESKVAGLSATTRAITRDRPEFLHLESQDQLAGGVFTLLERGRGTMAVDKQFTVGIDIGTSNSSVSVRPNNDPVFSLDLDMTRFAPAFTGNENDPGLVFVKVGATGTAIRTIQPWLPGIEGGRSASGHLGKRAAGLTQIPTLVLMPPRKTGQGREAATPKTIPVDEIPKLLPMRDVIIPPPDYMESFGAPEDHVTGTFDRLKWLSRMNDSERSEQFLQKYLEALFIFVAAKLRAKKPVTARLSYPLSFSLEDQRILTDRARAAASEVRHHTGVEIQPELYADESRCIVAAHVKSSEPPKAGGALNVVCDIGGGSIDIATVTYDPREKNNNPGSEPPSMVFLAADSVRFGANLVFDKLCDLVGSAIVAGTNRPDYEDFRREMFRQQLRQKGYAKLLDAAPSQKESAKLFVECYFALVREYLARSIAGTIRNPYRLAGAIHRFRNPQQQTRTRGQFDAGFGGGAPSVEELLAPYPNGNRWTQVPLEINLLFTGNGWKAFEAFGEGALLPGSRPMGSFVQALQARIAQLVRASVEGEDACVTQGYSAFADPRAMATVGLKRDQVYVLKEALADSILDYTRPRVNNDQHEVRINAACNGVSEQITGDGDFWSGPQTVSILPWYAFVGERSLRWKGDTLAPIEPPQGVLQPLANAVPLPDGRLTPAPSKELAELGARLGMSFELGTLFAQSQAEVQRLLRANVGEERDCSLLAAIYEKAIARRVFVANW
jgi:hypothetical protein